MKKTLSKPHPKYIPTQKESQVSDITAEMMFVDSIYYSLSRFSYDRPLKLSLEAREYLLSSAKSDPVDGPKVLQAIAINDMRYGIKARTETPFPIPKIPLRSLDQTLDNSQN